MKQIFKSNYGECVVYVQKTPLEEGSDERKNFARMTYPNVSGSEFIPYVKSLIYKIGTDVLITPEQLIIDHMADIGAIFDTPDRAITFVAFAARAELLPLRHIGIDLRGNDVYVFNGDTK